MSPYWFGFCLCLLLSHDAECLRKMHSMYEIIIREGCILYEKDLNDCWRRGKRGESTRVRTIYQMNYGLHVHLPTWLRASYGLRRDACCFLRPHYTVNAFWTRLQQRGPRCMHHFLPAQRRGSHQCCRRHLYDLISH